MSGSWLYQSLINNVYIPHFHTYGEKAYNSFINCAVAKKSFLWAYKNVTPIEELNESDKKELKLYVIGLFPNKTPAEKIESCKIIHTLGCLL